MAAENEATEMILKLAIDGVVQTLKITGSGAKNIVAALFALEENTRKGNFRTKGRMRLSNLMRHSNGQEVFDIKTTDSKEFFKACKSYGVLYVALKNVGDESDVRRVLVRQEDAPKINRIIEDLSINAVKTGAVSNLDERVKDEVEAEQSEEPKSKVDSVIDDVLKEEKDENPEPAPTESQSDPSELSWTNKKKLEDTMDPEIMSVETNMGRMSIEDYRDIKAFQSGFDSYDEMYNKGFRLGHGYDYDKAPESKSRKSKDVSITDKGIREHLKEFNEKARFQGDKSPIKVPVKPLGKEQTK